jgi:DNA-binding beta-propeller fold protein YncE
MNPPLRFGAAAFAVTPHLPSSRSTFVASTTAVRSRPNSTLIFAQRYSISASASPDPSPARPPRVRITRRGVLQLANAGLGVLTVGLLYRMQNQFRLLGPRGVLAALGLSAVTPRSAAAAGLNDALPAEKMRAAVEFVRQRDARSPPAPHFPAGADWINSRPLAFGKELKGKVVLLDFWTLCCINCQHVLPKLAELERQYGPDGSGGFVVVGVHSAKFTAERETRTVAAAVERYEVNHPVINDEQMTMWNAIGINSWPSFVLVGPRGNLLALWTGEQQERDIDAIVSGALEFYKDDIDHRPLPAAPPRSALLRKTSESPLRYPAKLVVSPDDQSIFVSDAGNNRILRIDVATGKYLAVYGSGAAGFTDSFDSSKVCFHTPQGMALRGNVLFVADTANHAVRAIDIPSGAVTTLGGTGEQGFDYKAGKVGLSQALSSPWDVEVDGNVLYVAMAGTHQIFSLNVGGSDGGRTTPWVVFSGSGRELEKNSSMARTASWSQPSHLSIGRQIVSKKDDTTERVMFVADSESSTVRAIYLDAPGGGMPTKTLCGGDGVLAENLFAYGDADGIGARAKLQHPLAVVDALDGKRAFVADSYNHR